MRLLVVTAVIGAVLMCGARRRIVSPARGVVDVAGTGVAGLSDGAVATAQFSSPRGIAVDPVTKSIIVADTGNHAIRKIENGQVTTIAIGLRLPHGVAVDRAGRIWICDTGNHLIRRIEIDGTMITVAGAGQFLFPEGIAIESDSSVIVADTGNHRLRRITGDTVTTIATFRAPSGVAVAADGRIYVVERDAGVVRTLESIVADGLHTPTAIAVIGESLFVSNTCDHAVLRLPGKDTIVDGLSFPYGLAPRDGELVIADTRHHRIRVWR